MTLAVSVRDVFVRLHRYAGLTTAAFLIVTGLTGSVLTFQHEIDAWLNPKLFYAPGDGTILPPSQLAARAEAADPRIRVFGVPLRVEPGWSARLGIQPRIDLATGKRFVLDFDQLFVDPATGAILGSRHSRAALIPLIYRFHYTLLDPSGIGMKVLGWIAVIWTVDCFVGFYLTLPRRGPFFGKWKKAWQIKRGASAYRINFDLHRAGALWLWAVLFCVALSSVYFNLHKELFKPVVGFFSPLTSTVFDSAPDRRRQASGPALSFDEIARIAAAEAQSRGWNKIAGGVIHHASFNAFGVRFWPSQYDRGNGIGPPILYFDDRNGRLLQAYVPGEGTAGDIAMHLQFPLHSGRIAGLPGRIAVCIGGIAVAMLSITGVIIWWRKRRASRFHVSLHHAKQPSS